mmetsp:Transcript_16292/g.32757  ORF Transcript_16292/g.32757 Transcript_16292/m.32757 type:complete len:273 (-) Transcript_16292:76-894(-)|eukprot:scaffold4740_cov165-Amphora_coffeaeformis.AAC.4
MSDDEDATSAMRQRFMTADEVYIYKIPPLKNSGGHRAEDWNLATPLKECSLLVERRGDAFVLEFQHSGNQVFALATCDVTKGGSAEHFLEQVVDSSRYFVVKIQGGGGREALIGFGFRDRDKAIDLRESLQHYQRAMERESQSETSPTSKFKVPELAEGEKIHVNVPGKGKSRTKGKSAGGGGGLFLLKKPPPPADGAGVETKSLLKPPPPPADGEDEETKVETKPVENVTISMENVNLQADADAVEKSDEGSDGAVFEGDQDGWKAEFDAK